MKKHILLLIFLLFFGGHSSSCFAGSGCLVSDINNFLVARWQMDDNCPNTVVVDCVGGYNGTSYRNTNLMAVSGGGFNFNGTTDIVNIPNPITSTFQKGFTISWKMLPANATPSIEEGIVGVQQQGYGILNIELIQTGIDAAYVPSIYDNGITNLTTSIDSSPSWTVVTLVVQQINPTTVEGLMYVNGQLGAVDSDTIETMSSFSTTRQLEIGDYDPISGGSVRYNGVLKDVRIYNKALTAAEVLALYRSVGGQ
jgi:hypothetical protein